MKALSAITLMLLFACGVSLQAQDSTSDWMQLELKDGSLLNGHVVNVTTEHVHMVGASINRLIPRDQLSDPSLRRVTKQFPIMIAAKATETATAEKLKDGLQLQRSRYFSRAPHTFTPYTRSTVYSPFSTTYYLPQGCSVAYPVYQHHSRPYHSFPSWSIQIDL